MKSKKSSKPSAPEFPKPASRRRVAIVLLAAGGSQRLGRPKQLLPFQGTTLLRRMAEIAAKSRSAEVVVVLGADAKAMKEQLDGLAVTVAENPEWKEGIGSSIRAGVGRVTDADGYLFMVIDQPAVTTEVLDRILGIFDSGESEIVAAEYDGTAGVPALFSAKFREELLALRGDRGAKSILDQHRSAVATVPFPAGGTDLDTPEDLERFETPEP